MRVPLTAILTTSAFLYTSAFLPAQTNAYRAPRLDGHPNLNGIWEAVNTANWNLQDHPASPGPLWELGAIAAVPAGRSVIDGGGAIPYKPDATAKQKANFQTRRTEDPEAKCYMPGIPRANYMPYPFQIVQTPKDLLFVYEFASSNRLINMGKAQEAGSDTWMGTNNGRWEGETLVIDVTGLNGLAWLDRNGDFTSDKVHVVERFTRTSPEVLMYTATIEDPSVFTKPWTISMPLYKRVEKDAQLLEFKCTEFAEELLYGKYKKGGQK
jgi:hypothetical protein